MREINVEQRLRIGLETRGFKVYKLVTPGHNGSPDRMILRPYWSPGPPWYIEIKAPGQKARRLQELVHGDWRARGLQVLHTVSTYSEVDALIAALVRECEATRPPLLYDLL